MREYEISKEEFKEVAEYIKNNDNDNVFGVGIEQVGNIPFDTCKEIHMLIDKIRELKPAYYEISNVTGISYNNLCKNMLNVGIFSYDNTRDMFTKYFYKLLSQYKRNLYNTNDLAQLFYVAAIIIRFDSLTLKGGSYDKQLTLSVYCDMKWLFFKYRKHALIEYGVEEINSLLEMTDEFRFYDDSNNSAGIAKLVDYFSDKTSARCFGKIHQGAFSMDFLIELLSTQIMACGTLDYL